MRRFLAIGSVWLGCALAWVVLGSTLVVRSGESSASLDPEVRQLWGPPLVQAAPTAHYVDVRQVERQRRVANADANTPSPTDGDAAQGQIRIETEIHEERSEVSVPIAASDITVDMDLEHRRRGLVYFPTFGVDFRGRYTFENPTDEPRELILYFPLQSESAVYDGFAVLDEHGAAIDVEIGGAEGPPPPEHHASSSGRRGSYLPAPPPGTARWSARVEPGARVAFEVRYRTRGTGTWRYRMGNGTNRVEDFRLVMRTDFKGIDFPADTLSPTEHGEVAGGWEGEWRFDRLIASRPIGVEPPSLTAPGPLAARITFFAPVGLLFFFFVVGVLASDAKRPLHPSHFFFLGTAFFAFHLLFAYLVDHVSIGIAFAASTLTALALVVSYTRLFTSWRFTLFAVAVPQVIYLVLFSLSFLLEGFTGLAITLGAIVTLFVMMQITGRRSRREAMTPEPSAKENEEAPQPNVF